MGLHYEKPGFGTFFFKMIFQINTFDGMMTKE